MINLCKFGCGNEATYYSKYSKSWRCEKHPTKCPELRKQNSAGVKKAMGKKTNNDWRERNEKTKKTCIEKYGTEHPQQNNRIREKTKKTCIEKYGVENPHQNIDVQNKTKATCNKIYGGNAPASSNRVLKKMKDTTIDRYGVENVAMLKETWDKIRQTNLEKRGVEYHMSDPSHNEKRTRMYKEKTGYDNPMQNPEVVKKINNTMMEKYGVKSPQQNKEIQEKTRQTCLKKYGVENPFYLKENRKKGGGISIEESKWLDEYNILPHNRNALLEGTTNIFVDGFEPDTNTVYEYYGSYWHGNPEKYNKEEYNDRTKCTHGKLYEKTMEREMKIKRLGYNIVVKWS